MRTRHPTILLAIVLVVGAILAPMALASPADHYDGPYYGEGNFPPGCIRDMSLSNPDNICHHMRSGLNALDSPQIDVLIMVPVSPTAERDMRIMRQSIEMWEGGIDYLAEEMGLEWLHEGVDFHITLDYVDLEDGGEFTTYPIVDPEVVVIATNPVGGVGIGVDPVWLGSEIGLTGDEGPCHGIANPFDFEAWENLPGFDSHHESRTGTYTEDCDGAGGNICFAVNGAIDPDPETIDFFGLFDLVSHEVGHCLTLGHVGDGAEGDWAVVPTNDIMAYHADPPELTKCASTLDVEVFATRMSRYLDTNGDGVVDEADRLFTNDQVGEGGNPFQVQHPDDHLYASGTGSPLDCPQPDVGPLPGERTDWTPEPIDTSPDAALTVSTPADGSITQDSTVTVSGTVEYVAAGTTSDTTESGAQVAEAGTILAVGDEPDTVTFEHPDGNVFHTEQSTLGTTDSLGVDPSHRFTLDVTQQSDIEFTLAFTDAVGGNDLDLYVTGAAEAQGATLANPETAVVRADGTLDIAVEPYFVTDPVDGATYTLVAEITPVTQPTDSDGDGVPDADDACPEEPGNGADGCPIEATEHVHVYVDDVLAASQDVDTTNGPDSFSIPVELAEGDHQLRVDWEDDGTVVATDSRTVTHDTDDDDDGVPNDEDVCPGFDDNADEDGDGIPDGCDGEIGSDRDGDGVADDVDNCPGHPNADQADTDGDGRGDACDPDIDGDGHSNGKERAHGTDPYDPDSHPVRGG